jgi:hypothetical protein
MKNIFYLIVLLLTIACKDNTTSLKENSSVTTEAVADIENPIADKNSKNPINKIIKIANIRFETDNLLEESKKIEKLVAKNNGIIQNDNSQKNEYNAYKNYTIRIPSTNFDSFIKQLDANVNYYDEKEIAQSDVTEEFIDLNARLFTKKQLENRYLQLLSKAKNVSEMLEIEQQLSVIREEIEAKTAQLKFLENQVSMSTITLEIYTNNPSEKGLSQSYFEKIWNQIKEGFDNLLSFLLGLISIWPFILIFVIGLVLVRRRIKHKKS